MQNRDNVPLWSSRVEQPPKEEPPDDYLTAVLKLIWTAFKALLDFIPFPINLALLILISLPLVAIIVGIHSFRLIRYLYLKSALTRWILIGALVVILAIVIIVVWHPLQ